MARFHAFYGEGFATTVMRLLPCALLLAAALEARLHRFRVYPNRSIEILAMAEGADGRIWLGAVDGLYTFDGFRYRRLDDYPLPSAYFLVAGPKGSLWAGGPGGLVRYQDGVFRKISGSAVLGLETASGYIVVAHQGELKRVERDGSLSLLSPARRGLVTREASGRVWFHCPDSLGACSLDPARPSSPREQAALPGEFEQFTRDSRGRFWAALKDRALVIDGGLEPEEHRRRSSQRTSRQPPLIPGQSGRVWFIGETIRELASGVVFDDGGALESYQVTAGLEDSRGAVWVAKLNLGLVKWVRDAGWEHWNTGDFGGESPAQVTRTRKGEIVVATRGNLYLRNGEAWKPIAAEKRDYAYILPLDDGGYLASVRKTGLLRLDRDGRVAEPIADPSGWPDSYRIIERDSKGRVWVGHKYALYRLDREGARHRLVRQELPASTVTPPDQAVTFAIDPRGRLWCGYQHGVAWLDDKGTWHRIETDQPVEIVRSIAAGSGAIWIAYRRSGPFSLLREEAGRWRATEFSPNAGYPPRDTHFIARDRRGWIWRGSTEGVHIFEGRGEPLPDRWLHIGRREGLAVDTTGQYGFFEDTDGSVWIAGEEGLAHITPSPAWFHPKPGPRTPLVSRMNGENPGTLRFELAALDAPEFHINPVRYRLRPQSKEWRGGGGAIEFPDLPRGSYTLEIAYAGDEEAGPLLAQSFQVGAPGSAWWPMVGLPLFGTASLLLLARRTRVWQRARYWLSKTVFLVRRRWRGNAATAPEFRSPVARAGETVFGRYHLVRPISHGGFAVVYEARDLENEGAKVAVKILRSKAPGADRWLRGRFAQEVAALRSVRHESVVPVLDSWVSLEGEPCLAMPLLEGPTLRAELGRSVLTPAGVGSFTRQIGSALCEIHRLGIVHRDLKPENIIRTGEERWVVIDFGTAGMRGPGLGLAATTLVSGSLAYMAPEQLTGHYSPASDVYSFALLILESLTGKRLSELQSISSESCFPEELAGVIAATAGPVDSARALAGLLAEAYRPEPNRRPADVQAWAAKVADVVERLEPVGHPA